MFRLYPYKLLKFHFNHNFRDERDVVARVFSLKFMFLSHLFCSYHHRYCFLHSAPPLLLLLPPHHTFRSLCVVVLRLCSCELLRKEILHLYKCKMEARVIIEPTTYNCILNIKI
ncbi:uncharacterized protein DS421_16g528860 [Arachis hypogaea]|nr:uncharacterized protein DS421_16g528860 [Arachis hypogaea]